MAYHCCKIFLLTTTLFISFQLISVDSVEFEVGEDKGWVVPSSKITDNIYNQWASKNRFQVGDRIRFKYEKDSVLLVNDSEYEQCNSAHPLFFSNNGNTVFQLDRPGLFYFISGANGHCERGQKMIIKVLEPENPPPSSNTTPTPPCDSSHHNAAIPISSTTVLQFIMSVLGFLFIQS